MPVHARAPDSGQVKPTQKPGEARSGKKVNFGGFEPPPFGTLYGLEQPVQDLEEAGFSGGKFRETGQKWPFWAPEPGFGPLRM